MVAATIGTALMILVVVSSLVIVRRRLPYETWYLVHLTVYAGIALAWFHQIPTGNELTADLAASDYWTALYLVTAALLVIFRSPCRPGKPIATVCASTPSRSRGRAWSRCASAGAISTGWAPAAASFPVALPRPATLVGLASVLALRGAGWPLAADHGQGLRGLQRAHRRGCAGDARAGRRAVRGLYCRGAATRAGALIAGGIGITPIRAMLDELSGDVALVYRVRRKEDLVFRDELDALARGRGIARSISWATTPRRTARTCSRPSTCASSSPTSPSARSLSAGRRR